MYYNKEPLKIYLKPNRQFFNFAFESGKAVIMDYSYLDRDILIDNNTVKFGQKAKDTIRSISDLKQILETLTKAVLKDISDYGMHSPGIDLSYVSLEYFTIESLPLNININHEEIGLLVNQLIFDILYDQYLMDSPRLTLKKYCDNCIDYTWDKSLYDTAIKRAVQDSDENLVLENEAEKLSLNPRIYVKCIKLALMDIKKSKIENLETHPELIKIAKVHKVEIDSYKKCIQYALKRAKGFSVEESGIAPEAYIERIKSAKVTSGSPKEKIDELTKIEELRDDAKKLGVEVNVYIRCLLIQLENAKSSAHKVMSAEVTKETYIRNRPELRKEALQLGMDPDVHLELNGTLNDRFKSNRQRPKWTWDYKYYNRHMITSKQYDRNFGVDHNKRNYRFENFNYDFDYYDSFVERFMPKGDDTEYDFFRKTMDFYHLEIYKRLDFIYKLAVHMENAGIDSISKDHYLVKRFTPLVLCPYIKDNAICFGEKNKYYRPLLFIEDMWQEKNQLEHNTAYYDISIKYHLLRAKTYELFKYHYEFTTDDYLEISEFIGKHYDVLSYHEKNKAWIVQERKPRMQTTRIKNAKQISDALFGSRII